MRPVPGFIEQYDDLRQISNRKADKDALTLCAIGRNEMYFLPTFLAHYRRLGVEQFAILDDRSTDGMTEYLLEQNDVVLYRSDHKYGSRNAGGGSRSILMSSCNCRTGRHYKLWKTPSNSRMRSWSTG